MIQRQDLKQPTWFCVKVKQKISQSLHNKVVLVGLMCWTTSGSIAAKHPAESQHQAELS